MKNRLFSISSFLFIIIFIIPVCVVSIYYIAFASDRYESTASIYITKESTKSNPFDLSLIGITNSSSARDILVLKAFIESPKMLDLLDKDLNLRKHFSNPKYDYFSRLSKNSSKETFFEYYLKHVTMVFDDEARLLLLKTQSFDRHYSESILNGILKHSQTFIDKLNTNISSSQLKFFDAQVKKSEMELAKEKSKLLQFQKQNNILSTKLTAGTIISTITALESELAAKKSLLSSRLDVLSEQAPAIRRLRSSIQGLEKQIALENARLTNKDGNALSDLDAKFQEIKLFLEYKTLRYKSNIDAYEQAQNEAARRLRFLTVVSPPTLADEALYPNRPYIILTTAIIALFLYFIASIMVATIREHT